MQRKRWQTWGVLVLFLVPFVLGAQECKNYDNQNHIIALVNQSRAENGLPPLNGHIGLINDADDWAARIAAQGALSHSTTQGVYYTWARIGGGENVGSGPSMEAIHQAYMNSPPHRANILSPDYHYIGAGYAVGGDGLVYTVLQFTFTAP